MNKNSAKKTFNPLIDDVKPLSRQSFELAPEPEKNVELDTTTPAFVYREPRRFTLADLPRYADSLYGVLRDMFPGIHERMYQSWLSGCINDNSCLFLCIDAPDGAPGAACMAFFRHDPLMPQPYAHVVFVVGLGEVRKQMYERVVKWAREAGCKEVRAFTVLDEDTLKDIKGVSFEKITSFSLGLEEADA